MTQAVLDVIAENPQIQHVANQVHPAPMHEHAGENILNISQIDPVQEIRWNQGVFVIDTFKITAV